MTPDEESMMSVVAWLERRKYDVCPDCFLDHSQKCVARCQCSVLSFSIIIRVGPYLDSSRALPGTRALTRASRQSRRRDVETQSSPKDWSFWRVKS